MCHVGDGVPGRLRPVDPLLLSRPAPSGLRGKVEAWGPIHCRPGRGETRTGRDLLYLIRSPEVDQKNR